MLLLERILQDLDTRTSQDHPRRAFIQAPLTQGTCKIFTQGPLRKDFPRISTRSPDKDVHKITQAPGKDFTKISKRSSHNDLCEICKDLLEDVSEIFRPSRELIRSLPIPGSHRLSQKQHHTPTRAIRHTQSAETVALRMSKFALRYSQRERSDTHKAPRLRRLREQYQNSHCATTRAIRHAQSHQRVARAHVRLSQKKCAHHET